MVFEDVLAKGDYVLYYIRIEKYEVGRLGKGLTALFSILTGALRMGGGQVSFLCMDCECWVRLLCVVTMKIV